ncbi:hypothetical protein PG987_007981 [Apiospora arundinis]
MSAIWISTLPQTYRDATLKIRYLWIDSLCTVQDDSEDWSIEASKVADVYEGSYFTIAASSSPDGRGGLFLDSIASATRMDLQREGQSSGADTNGTVGTDSTDINTCYLEYPLASSDMVRNGPLSGRAWVLQEQILSTSLVHFTESQTFFQCTAGLTSEDGVLVDEKYPLPARSRESTSWKWERGYNWSALVTEYRQRSITRDSDRMAAMAGIVKAFSQRVGGKSALGLWEDTIWMDLGWYSLHAWDHRTDFEDPSLRRHDWLLLFESILSLARSL